MPLPNGPQEEKQKNLHFHGSWVGLTSERANDVQRKSREWQLIRALLRNEPVDWLEGFVLFPTWREAKQSGHYPQLFRRVSCRVLEELRNKPFEIEARLDHPKASPTHWQLSLPNGGAIESNIWKAVRIAKEGGDEFRAGRPAAGWHLISEAYNIYPDAKSLCQALVCASVLPNNPKTYEKCLSGIKTLLEDHKQVVRDALYNVLDRASGNRQGITNTIAESAFNRWFGELLQIQSVLRLLSMHTLSMPTASTAAIKEFATLVTKCGDLLECVTQFTERSTAPAKDVPPDQEARMAEQEFETCLRQLCTCDAVDGVCESTITYFEQQPHRRIDAGAISENREAAILAFLPHSRRDTADPDRLYAMFNTAFHRYIGAVGTKEGVATPPESTRGGSEKWQRYSQVLEDMVGAEQTKDQLWQLFGLYQQPSSDQHGAVLPIAGTVCPLGGPDSLQSGGLEVVGLDHGYLKSIDHVLRKGSGEDAELFRKGGPIAVDFDAGMVCPRPEASNELQKLVLENEFSLLEGERAAGKTVLARGLGYHLAEAEGMVVYWFDCDSEMNLDIKQLIKEMRGLRGVFIIENIHLYTKEFQRLYYSLGRDSLRHVLFTARPSFRELESERQWRLSSLGRLSMESYDDIDDLMEFFARRHPEMEWAEDVHSAFREGCGGDLWCLSYSLTGYCDTRGAGCVRNWAAAGVKSELRELEKLNRVWPEVLVAISALYREGNWTAESFLIDRLGFQIDILQELTVRGDIRRVTEQGHFFYGGTHSTLADLYWEYGKEYRRRRGLPEYEEYLYEYAAAGTPNGLLAVMQTRATTRQSVVGRLYTDGKLPSAITSEEGMAGAFLWRVFDGAYVQDAQVMQAIGDKISVTNDLTNAGHCLTGPRDVTGKIDPIVWKYVDRRRLAQNVSRAKDFRGLESFLIDLPDKKAGKEICNLLDLQCLAAGIMAAENPDRACGVIRRLFRFSTEVGHKLWSLVDHKQLAMVLQYRDPDELCYAVGSLFFGCDDAGGKLWRLIDKEMLKSKLNALQGIVQLTECIKGMFGVFDVVDIRPMGMVDALRFWMCDSKWMNACDQFYEMIDLAAVAHNLESCQDARDAVICLANIYGTDKERGVELMCDVVGRDKVLDMLLRASLDLYLYDYIRIIIDAEEVCLDEQAYLRAAFCSHLDIESLAAKLSSGIHFLSYYGTDCLSVVNELDPDCAHRLCEKLQIEALAECLRREEDSARVTRCVNVIKSVNSDVGTALSALLRRP